MASRHPLGSARWPALLALLSPALAAAQNSDGILLGAEAATTAGAVVAVRGDAASAYYNPAGLADLQGPTVQVSGSAYSLTVMRLDPFVETRLPWARRTQSVRSTSFYAAPSVVANGLRLRPGLGVAAGVWVPSHEVLAFSASLQTEGPWAPGGSVTRASYEQHLSISEKLDRTCFGAAAGLALAPGLRVGASGFVTYDTAEELVSLFAVAATDSPVPEERGGTVSITSSGSPSQFALRLGGGVQWDVAPAVTLAAAVKTPSMVLARQGSVTTTSSATALYPGVTPTIFFARSRQQLRLAEPWRITAGAAAGQGGLTVRGELDWQAPTTGQRGVVNARVGVLLDAGDVRGGAGLFTDRARDLASGGGLAVDYTGATAGLSFRPGPVRVAHARGGSWDLWTSVGLRYAHGVGRATGLGLAPMGGQQAPASARVRVDSLTATLGGVVEY
jgi:hypothetical protein